MEDLYLTEWQYLLSNRKKVVRPCVNTNLRLDNDKFKCNATVNKKYSYSISTLSVKKKLLSDFKLS